MHKKISSAGPLYAEEIFSKNILSEKTHESETNLISLFINHIKPK